MSMDELYKRRIRIEGKPNTFGGYGIEIRDLETGELITGIKSAIVYLDASEINQAQLTYYERGTGDTILVDENGEAVSSHIVVDNPDIAVTALERFAQEEQAE